MITPQNSIESILNAIANADRSVGWMAYQMNESARQEHWYPALAALFILTEQVLRWAGAASDKETLKELIKRSLDAGLLSQQEASILDTLREYRNKYMHADFHSNAFVFDDLIYPVNDIEAAEYIYGTMALPCLQIIQGLVTSEA